MTDSDKKRFAVAMVAMFKAFGKEWDVDIAKLSFSALSKFSIDESEACISRAIENEPHFPTVFALKRYITQTPTRPKAIEYNPPVNKQLAADAMDLIERTLAGEITRKQVIEEMLLMDDKYPNIGYREESDKLANFYRESNLPYR